MNTPAVPPPPESDRRALEAFVVENAELERLEALLGQFNLFEAIGAVRSELRHSDFLSFLLDPTQNHGLGLAFLKRLLQKTLVRAAGVQTGVSPIDLDVWDLSDTLVLREWQNTDILCLNERHELTVLIENKIDAGEHADQLRRYLDVVQAHYPTHRTIALYLTPGGDDPSDGRYIPIDYTFVCETLEKLLEARRSTLGEAVLTTLVHYTQMLRRHIVSDSEIAELARQIYAKHRRALDLIYEHRPDLQSQLAEELQRLVRAEPTLQLDYYTKSYVNFCPQSWDGIAGLRRGQGWTASKRLLLFEFKNVPDLLRLYLLIGPGDEGVRKALFKAGQARPDLFRGATRTLYPRMTMLWSRAFLNKKDYQDTEPENLLEKVRQEWSRFVGHDLPALTQAVEQVGFPPTGESEAPIGE
jgi:hypothetical protein